MARNRRQLTLDEAKALAGRWHDMGEALREAHQLASRFSDAGPHRVIEMWESGRNERGQRLSKFEVQGSRGAMGRTVRLPSARHE